MPANLTPQYRDVEQKYRKATTLAEKIATLREMMAVIPKHKGTDHLRAELRARMSRHLEELEKPKQTGARGPQPFSIKKEGVGQALIIGFSNVGKSELLNALTGTDSKVGDYSFSTQAPKIGMLMFENILIQMVDTPALNDRDVQTRLFGLLRNADVLLVTLDLSGHIVDEIREVIGLLEEWGYSLKGTGESFDEQSVLVQKRAILVCNKSDSRDVENKVLEIISSYGSRFPVVRVSSITGANLDVLTKQIFDTLDIVRVYTKSPGQSFDYRAPIVMLCGGTVINAAERLHNQWSSKLKYALLWGSSKYDGQRVGRDYVLSDGDVLEFH